MISTTNTSQQPINRRLVASVVTLSLWRWRQQWFLLLMICIGMIAAITIVRTWSIHGNINLIYLCQYQKKTIERMLVEHDG